MSESHSQSQHNHELTGPSTVFRSEQRFTDPALAAADPQPDWFAATVGGLGLGLFLGWALVSALASEGFGSFAVPKLPLAVVLALGVLVGVLAAARPAHRAARMNVLSAIATE